MRSATFAALLITSASLACGESVAPDEPVATVEIAEVLIEGGIDRLRPVFAAEALGSRAAATTSPSS